jgi:cysteine-rich repeat protein
VKWARTEVDSIKTSGASMSALDNVKCVSKDDACAPLQMRSGDQSSPSRRGRFFDRSPFAAYAFKSNGADVLRMNPMPFPWDPGRCTLQGVDATPSGIAARLRGNFVVPETGIQTFAIHADDGYTLTIGGVLVAGFDGSRRGGIETRRAQFPEAGVYPMEIMYWNTGGSGIFEVFVSRRELCFEAQRAVDGCAQGFDLTDAPRQSVSPAVFESFERLGQGQVDLPTWVTMSDKAFGPTDERCAQAEVNVTCGLSATEACGNGVRERVAAASMNLNDESCDDGNRSDGDGCSSSCEVEAGFVCAGSLPSRCVRVNGNTSIGVNGSPSIERPETADAAPSPSLLRVGCSAASSAGEIGALWGLALSWRRRRAFRCRMK